MLAALDLPSTWVLRDPVFLGVLALVPVALWWRARRVAPAVLFAPTGVGLRTPVPATWRTRLAFAPRVCEVAALLLAAFALARPVQEVPLPREREGIDIVLCLDVSSSMTATDLDPNRARLAVAKEAAQRFIAARPDDRIGLVTFARYPDIVCPRTLDHRALTQALDHVTLVAADGPEDATGIGAAVARCAAVLAASAGRSKVVVLLTDGEENVATAEAPGEIPPLHAAQLCAELGVRVYAIAAGLGRTSGTGAARPSFEPIDTQPIEALAARSGGRFFAARDASALSDVYSEIDALETAALREPRVVLEERFFAFAAAALALLVLSRVLRAAAFEVVA